jgi:hypothetical protein
MFDRTWPSAVAELIFFVLILGIQLTSIMNFDASVFPDSHPRNAESDGGYRL